MISGRDVTALPPERRRVGMVFQSYALFPHLSARANVAFGLEARGVARDERKRRVEAGPCVLEGRAWSGPAPVAAVEVSADGGASWAEAEVLAGPSRWAWSSWRFAWEARPGAYELCCRARDGDGRAQPLVPSWNLGGYANNAVQRVPVVVA